MSGSWFFDDAPNIVDNRDIQPADPDVPTLLNAALSSPSSDLKRPLASLSFTANYLASGLDPWPWKLTNLLIHLANGSLVYLLAKLLIGAASVGRDREAPAPLLAALVAAAWLLMPINLTAVLYVVQRMESMANLFVLLGLIGYVRGRLRMQRDGPGFGICVGSLFFGTAVGLLAKETAVMLPLYALLIEAILFRFRTGQRDLRIGLLHALLLGVPAVLGLALLIPWLVDPATWATRDFTLYTRVLSELRIVPAYMGWIVFPLPQSLSFYHDSFAISQGILSPWTTFAGAITIGVLVSVSYALRAHRPLVSLGIALYLSSHLLTGTVLPLELVFEHRNYFGSFAVALAIVPLLCEPGLVAIPRRLLLGILFAWWAILTHWTALAWSEPLRLAAELAVRAPDSPRARYAYAEALLYQSDYAPHSPMFQKAWQELESASSMPESSIQPEQALILTSSLLGRPLQETWWNRIDDKLRRSKPNSEDVGALGGLVRCAVDGRCILPHDRMDEALNIARSHSAPSAKLLAICSDWTWSVKRDRKSGLRLAQQAVEVEPKEVEHRVALARMYIVLDRVELAHSQLDAIQALNFGGRFDRQIGELSAAVDASSRR